MEYVDNKSFTDGGIVVKNRQLMQRNREKLDAIEIRVRNLNVQPPQFTFHEREVSYESFRLSDSVDLIHSQLDELEKLGENEKSVKLLDLYDRLNDVEKSLEELENMPYA